VEGCAILEAENSTYLLPEGWSLQIDPYGNARVTHATAASKSREASLQEARSHGGKR
jgi:hypothetical protein